ncbi:hypothetical protein Salat_1120500 [Sesamum alatum]|uniref:Uncharacterized protein n=1 Tax=Sesamum alatum TaxID=300844 RepID=A0AAE2CT38_9LAMI|nr:hypothetical protein Salat_1120500 [Sesamum alatum]
MVAEPTMLPQLVPTASLPPRLGPSLRSRRLAPAALFVPTPGLPPRPLLPPFLPPRTTPAQSLLPLPPPVPTTEATPPHKGVNIRASQHFSHRVCLQPKINKDQIEKSSSSFIMKDGKKYVTLSNLNKVIGDKGKEKKESKRRIALFRDFNLVFDFVK